MIIKTSEFNDLDIRDCELTGYDLAKYADDKANATQQPIINPHPDRLIVTSNQYDELCGVFGADTAKRTGDDVSNKTRIHNGGDRTK